MTKKRTEDLSDETARAALAVGMTPADQIRWLIDFSRRDLSERDQVELAVREIAWFCGTAGQGVHAHGFELQGLINGPLRVLNVPLSTDEARELQREARTALEAFRSGGWFPFPEPAFAGLQYIPGLLERLTPDRRRNSETRALARGLERASAMPSRFVLLSRPKSARSLFWAVVSLTLVGTPALRLCREPSCGTPFMAGRADQEFCSGRCRNRAAQATFRKRQATMLLDARHQRYRKQVEKKLGPELVDALGGALVRRRPRPKHQARMGK